MKNEIYSGLVRSASDPKGYCAIVLTEEVNTLLCWWSEKDGEQAGKDVILWHMAPWERSKAIERAVKEADALRATPFGASGKEGAA